MGLTKAQIEAHKKKMQKKVWTTEEKETLIQLVKSGVDSPTYIYSAGIFPGKSFDSIRWQTYKIKKGGNK